MNFPPVRSVKFYKHSEIEYMVGCLIASNPGCSNQLKQYINNLETVLYKDQVLNVLQVNSDIHIRHLKNYLCFRWDNQIEAMIIDILEKHK